MPHSDMLQLEGIVTDVLPGSRFRVNIGTKQVLLAHISGKIRTNGIKILNGDKVTLEVSPYDLTKGRIIWRQK